jgi:hypothetical protein
MPKALPLEEKALRYAIGVAQKKFLEEKLHQTAIVTTKLVKGAIA